MIVYTSVLTATLYQQSSLFPPVQLDFCLSGCNFLQVVVRKTGNPVSLTASGAPATPSYYVLLSHQSEKSLLGSHVNFRLEFGSKNQTFHEVWCCVALSFSFYFQHYHVFFCAFVFFMVFYFLHTFANLAFWSNWRILAILPGQYFCFELQHPSKLFLFYNRVNSILCQVLCSC